MRNVRMVIAAATAAAATVGVMGLAGPALAQPHVAVAATTVTVPAEVATSISLPKCPTGTTASFGSSTPALPDGATGAVFPVGNKNLEKLVGAWPVPGTASYTVVTNCSGGTKTTATVKVTKAPPLKSITGVGSDTITPVMDQATADYNTTAPAAKAYSFDAVNPDTGAIGDSITPKVGCTPIARPNGSSAGIAAFHTSQVVSGVNCLNFARSSRPRSSSDPPFATGGVAFVALAGDAVTWAHQTTTNAPKTLTVAQLNAIYSCTDTNWSQVGGKSGTIQPFLPQSGSGTLAFFEAAIGITTPGPCVSNVNNTLEENEGVNPALQSPNAIYVYSIGDWIAQKFHSAACTNSGCTATPACAPAPGKNLFGCDVHGVSVLGQINGVAPTTGSGVGTTINSAFPSTFDRVLYNVVPFDPNTADNIPGSESGAPGGLNLEPLFGASGYLCTAAQAKTDIKDYGFVSLPNCGTTS